MGANLSHPLGTQEWKIWDLLWTSVRRMGLQLKALENPPTNSFSIQYVWDKRT